MTIETDPHAAQDIGTKIQTLKKILQLIPLTIVHKNSIGISITQNV